ncbi:MAG: hypothetical protein ABSE93_11055 [Terriglobia bacterium]
MTKTDHPVCSKARWQGREAYTLSNGLLQMVNLTGGGHIAELRFADGSGFPTLNPLWIPKWKGMEPFQYRSKAHAKRYGPISEGKLLSGIAGHNICLDYFGAPSEEEAAQGLSTHGEAPSLKWRKSSARLTARQLSVTLSVHLPEAGLQFSREIEMRAGESVVYLKETVTNERKLDHFFHWTQHVTLAPPFVAPEDGRVFMSATKGITSPGGYDGKALLESGKEFQWPIAPASTGGEVDLSHCLTRKGLGIIASVLLDPARDVQFVGALNTRHRLLFAYCFHRADYPWVTIWEENCARESAPWNGRAQTRGLEFGSAPLPVTRREAFTRGPIFGTPTFSTVPARGRLTIPYVAFLAHLPEGFGEVRDISLGKNEILVQGREPDQVVTVPASGLAAAGLAEQ